MINSDNDILTYKFYIEGQVKFHEVDSRQKLGISVGIGVSCSAIAIIDAGDAAKDIAAL